MSDVPDSSVVEKLPLHPAEHDVVADVVAIKATDTRLSAGSLLRQARESSGLHIVTLAASLKVPVKKLEALEADRFDLLHDAVFVRALASSVCRNLKIDTAPILERLPQTGSPKLATKGMGMNTPFRAPGDKRGASIWAQVSRPTVLAGLVLMLSALILILLPAAKTGVEANNPNVASKATNSQPSMLAVIEAVAEAVSPGAPAPPSSFSQLSLSSPAVSSTVSATALPLIAIPSPSSPAPAAALQALAEPANPASAVSSVTSTGIVVFTAKGASWVEVTDSKGVVVLRRTLGTGEVVGASGVLPLSAIVGRADATLVQIRGNVFDLSAVAKDNVARFEVK